MAGNLGSVGGSSQPPSQQPLRKDQNTLPWLVDWSPNARSAGLVYHSKKGRGHGEKKKKGKEKRGTHD